MLRVKRMTGVLLLALVMSAVPWTAARADQSEKVAVQQDQGKSTREQVPAAGHPELFIGSRSYDAGEVWEGTDIVHTFIAENRGTTQLDITRVNPG